MSGHSKWSTIKHQKGATDAKRGALFTKLTRDLTLAVRDGGGSDPDTNFRLRLAIDKARNSNMPQDIIARAVKRGSGEGAEGKENLEEVTYEGYSPGGGAIFLQAVTTNRNRTAADVRTAFSRGGGNLGESGCVAWNFETNGLITFEIDNETLAEEMSLAAIDAGAEDVNLEDGLLEVHTTPANLLDVKQSLETQGAVPQSAEVSMVPKTTVLLESKEAEQTLRLLDSLEELADIQKAYTNADFPPEVLQAYQEAS
jgi:YebC/PmpR family DNA-binding regulatory protein